MVINMEIRENAFAKINLSLDVLGKRDDGYHGILSVMQSIALYDYVTIKVVPREDYDTSINYVKSYPTRNIAIGRGLPRDSRNTAVRAADAFFAFTGIKGFRAEITLDKHIPVGAGLGGGSSDAAAVLRGLNRLFETRLSAEFLRALGEGVGSDVPFCVEGGTVIARGRGEFLEPIAPFPNCEIVIVKPTFSVSTAELFAAFDRTKVRCHPETNSLVAAITDGDLHRAVRYLYNVFEDVLPPHQGAEIASIREKLLDEGALGAVMTGTGSAVFGIFESGAIAAADKLRESYKDVFVC